MPGPAEVQAFFDALEEERISLAKGLHGWLSG